MVKKSIGCVIVALLMASVASADTFRFMGTGNWEDSQWQNQTQGLTDVAPPDPCDVARMNWGNGTCTLSTATEVLKLQIGVDEPGNLIIANGGHLTTGHTWSSVGNNGDLTGTLTVETGGTWDLVGDGTAQGQHLWIGHSAGTTGIVNINGGTIYVGQMFGLGWGGGIGYMNVNDGGVLDLFQLHGDGASSMQNGSILDITGSGKVLLPGDYTGVINAYVANGSIYGNGVLGNIAIDVADGVTTVTAIYIDPEAPFGEARKPNPGNATQGVSIKPILSWTPGDFVQALNEHDVYFGETFDDVNDATKADHPNVTYVNRDVNNFDPGDLEFGKIYYWRVDEVNNTSIDGPWKGPVWNFVTDDGIGVDDMEPYVIWSNLVGPHIFVVWQDGPGDCGGTGNNTGAVLTEQNSDPDLILNGSQSMQYAYDNDGSVYSPCTSGDVDNRKKYSRIEAQTTDLPSGIGSDWTIGGVKALTINFRGQLGNDVKPMWVQLQDASKTYGNKITYGDSTGENPDHMNDAAWRQWNIKLEDFSVDLENVVSIVIGIGDEDEMGGAGAGTMYFDDITLHGSRCIRKPLLSEGNLNDDCAIDFRDFAIMAENYLVPGMFP